MARFEHIGYAVTVGIQIPMVGNAVQIIVKTGFDVPVDVANGQVVIIIIQINGNAVVIGICQRIYPTRFVHIRDTVVVVIQIHIITNAIIVMVNQ